MRQNLTTYRLFNCCSRKRGRRGRLGRNGRVGASPITAATEEWRVGTKGEPWAAKKKEYTGSAKGDSSCCSSWPRIHHRQWLHWGWASCGQHQQLMEACCHPTIVLWLVSHSHRWSSAKMLFLFLPRGRLSLALPEHLHSIYWSFSSPGAGGLRGRGTWCPAGSLRPCSVTPKPKGWGDWGGPRFEVQPNKTRAGTLAWPASACRSVAAP